MDGLAPREIYAFGDFRLDVGRRSLLRSAGNLPLRIAPKVFDAGLMLVRHAGQLLLKRTLLDGLWPGLVVEENSLAQVVSELRHALGDGAGEHRYVATVPRRGYQFVAEVSRIDACSCAAPPGARTVVVSAFVNLSGRAGDDWIGVALADGIRHQLGLLPCLSVAARCQVAGADYAEPDYLVQGQLQHSGRRLRALVQLVEPATGTQAWSAVVEGTAHGIFDLQDALATRVARALRQRLNAPPGVASVTGESQGRAAGTRKSLFSAASVAASRP